MYTVSPMKTGVMGGLVKDLGSTVTKKLVGWTDVGEEGFFSASVIWLRRSATPVAAVSSTGHAGRPSSDIGLRAPCLSGPQL